MQLQTVSEDGSKPELFENTCLLSPSKIKEENQNIN